MKAPETPANEPDRLLALQNTDLLDTPPEERFDRLTRMAKLAFSVPIALVSLVDEKRQWFKSCQGLDARQTSRDISFCGHAIHSPQLFIIEDTHRDSRFSDNPLVTGAPYIRFYAGAPLHNKEGYRLGTLCIIGTRPQSLDSAQQELLRELAQCAEDEINDFEARESRREQLEKTRILSALNRLTVDTSGSLEQKITMALDLGLGHLGLETGIVSEINEEIYTIRWFRAPDDSVLTTGLSIPVNQTYCSLMLEKRDHLAISHMANSEYRNQPCYAEQGLESYIAAPIEFDGKLFGTLNFSSVSPRTTPFTDLDRLFIVGLAQWTAALLQQHVHEDTLKKLSVNVPGMLYQFQRYPDGRSRFPYSSEGIYDIYGVSPEAAKEDASYAFDAIHPEDVAHVTESIQQSQESLSVWESQYRVKISGDNWKWVEGRATPEHRPDGSSIWHGFIANIDEQKRTQLALQESEQQLRAFFELSPIGIVLTDFYSGQNRDANAALLDCTGYTYSEFMELEYWDVTPPGYEKHKQQAAKDLKEHGRYGPFEQEIKRKDGALVPVLIQGILVKSVAGEPLIWSLVEDISERRRMDRLKSEFISTVSHELRTPLTSIVGSLDLVSSGIAGPLPDKARNMLEIATRNGRQLTDLINDLLDIDKLVAGKMSFQLEPAPLRQILEEAAEANQPLGERRNIAIRLGTVPDSLSVQVDTRHMAQALNNLLSNAIKFSDQGSDVELFATEKDGLATIFVRDYGEGIPREFQEQVFDKFAQADGSATRSKGGTGLGLAITRELITRMDGSVGFTSTPGEGSTFWISLPENVA
ncbi:ATP-binding protein [Marinobacter sp. HL-58]|uniref:ATP-binding protein n=1 Tax=Marinobacter sp. HL-58 TaxID=1479237 RepID=UPI0004895814|nr:ATP-binding protein [Marinobacter sp. HL-58]KPP97362.1 MAG: two component signal transduction system histidine kinase with PAS sensory domain [Marinobacter sp. HL-58]